MEPGNIILNGQKREFLVEREPWHVAFRSAFAELFSARPLLGRAAGPALYRAPRIDVEVNPWHDSFFQTVRGTFSPERLPPLAVTSKPVRVADIWETRVYKESVQRWQLASVLGHVTAFVLLTLPLVPQLTSEPPKPVELIASEISPYKMTLPPSLKKAGGGGGGGERSPVPAVKGRLPKFSFEQLSPPTAVIRNPNPKMAVTPTVVVPPDITLQSPNLQQYGDPLALQAVVLSGGPGSGSGIGTGAGGGVGSGWGPGVGPGWGGGTGGGPYRIGGNVNAPVCLYCPKPEFSEEARKAKYQGIVVLWAVVDEQGHVRSLRVAKSLGLGLDEQAIQTVQTWRFRPAERFGKAVPVEFVIEVEFTLY